MLTREQLEREERRTARRRTAVVKATAQQLFLCTPAEHADRTEGESPLAEVAAPCLRLQLVVPLRPQSGEILRGPALGELVSLRSCFREVHRPSLTTAPLRSPRWRTGSSSSPATARGRSLRRRRGAFSRRPAPSSTGTCARPART